VKQHLVPEWFHTGAALRDFLVEAADTLGVVREVQLFVSRDDAGGQSARLGHHLDVDGLHLHRCLENILGRLRLSTFCIRLPLRGRLGLGTFCILALRGRLRPCLLREDIK
jgi:hypothetical protein